MHLYCALQKYVDLVKNETAILKILPIHSVHCTKINGLVDAFISNVIDTGSKAFKGRDYIRGLEL